MSVYDDDKYSWLPEEKTFIKNCIGAGKPVLGICLGAQLAALCLGAEVHKAPHKEIGWFNVKPTDECKSLPWFSQLFKEHPTVFHWHGDQFDIPEGSINLLTSSANDNQAFCYNEKVIGLQFHLEVKRENIEQLVNNCRYELIPSTFVQAEEEILQMNHVATMNKIMAAVLDQLILSSFDVHK
jgi:GMP synthase-like glutamine amidotransferase